MKASLTLRCVLFQADEADVFDIRFNGVPLMIITRDAEWKDAQIFSPRPQRNSGGRDGYQIETQQRLLRLDCAVPRAAWKLGENQAEISLSSRAPSAKPPVQLEKVEVNLSLRYQ